MLASILVLFVILFFVFQTVLLYFYIVLVVSQAPYFTFLQLLLFGKIIDQTRFLI